MVNRQIGVGDAKYIVVSFYTLGDQECSRVKLSFTTLAGMQKTVTRIAA